MKRIISLTLAVIMVSSLMACGKQTGNSGGQDSSSKKVIAGIVFQEDQFMKLLSAGYAAAASEFGYEIKQANTNNDQSKETDFINTYTAEKIGGIAISPMSVDVSVASLKAASDAGLKIAVCNAPIDSFPFSEGTYTSDDVAFCKQTGDAAAAFIKASYDRPVKVGIIQYVTQVPEQSTNRVNGFKSGLDSAGVEYEIIADQDAWLQDMAITKAGDMIAANQDLDIIFCANEGGTVGTTMAVANAGKAGQIFVFGTDSSEQIVDLLKDDNNVLQAVTGQSPFDIGYQTAKALIDALEGKTVAGAGKTNIVNGVPLSRGDNAALDAFLADLSQKMQ